MPRAPQTPPQPRQRPLWPVLVFLILFTAGVIVLSHYYILPTLRTFIDANRSGDKSGAKAISATSALLLAVILLILIAGVLLTFRIGRLFFPRERPPRAQTQYVDAWAESAKRMEAPPPDGAEDDDD